MHIVWTVIDVGLVIALCCEFGVYVCMRISHRGVRFSHDEVLAHVENLYFWRKSNHVERHSFLFFKMLSQAPPRNGFESSNESFISSLKMNISSKSVKSHKLEKEANYQTKS